MSFRFNPTPLNFLSVKGKEAVAVESMSLHSRRILLDRILASRMTLARLCGSMCEKAGFRFSSSRKGLGADEEIESAWDPSTATPAVTFSEVSPVSVVFDWFATTKVGVHKCGGVYAAYVLKMCIIPPLTISTSTLFGSPPSFPPLTISANIHFDSRPPQIPDPLGHPPTMHKTSFHPA